MRERVVKQTGGEVLVNGNFNSVFGQTRKVFNEKYGHLISDVSNNVSHK